MSNVLMPHHYARFPIEPIRFAQVNGLSMLQANTIKYICRYDAKNGLEDVEKAGRCIDLLAKQVQGVPNWWDKSDPEWELWVERFDLSKFPREFVITPGTFCTENKLTPFQSRAIEAVCRFPLAKDPVGELELARAYVDALIVGLKAIEPKRHDITGFYGPDGCLLDPEVHWDGEG